MTTGLALQANADENLICGVAGQPPFSRRGILRGRAIAENTAEMVRKFDIRGLTQDKPVRSLSGGNMQKIVLAREISRIAQKKELVQDILIEINLAGEQSKSGVAPEQLEPLLEQVCQLPALRVRGLMAIPPISEKPGQNRPYFSALRQLFVDIKSKKYDNTYMDCLSMGMTRDFCDAIAEGSTLVRIGTGIYGPRMYKEEH